MTKLKGKRMRFLYAAGLVAAFFCVIAVAACGNPYRDVAEPTEIADADLAVVLDFASGQQSRTVDIADYVDENGATGVRYEAEAVQQGIVSLSEIENDAFTITALSDGTELVHIRVYQNDTLKFTVILSVTVTKPALQNATVSGIADGTRYTMTGASSVEIGSAYTFTVTRKSGVVGTPAVSVKIAGVTQAAITPTESPTGTFTFTIPAAKVTGDITLGAVTGLQNRYAVDLTAAQASSGCTVTGDSSVTEGNAYSFTVVLASGVVGTPAVSVKIAGVTQAAITPTESPTGTFTFTIPAAKVTGDITLGAVTGLSQALAVTGIEAGEGYAMTGSKTAHAGQSYQFAIVRDEGYHGVPYTMITADGVQAAFGMTESPIGTFTYTLPASAVTGDIVIGAVSGITADYFVEQNYNAFFANTLVHAQEWSNNPAQGGGTLTMQDGGLFFAKGANKLTQLDVPNDLIRNFADESWAVGASGDTDAYRMSLYLQASGGFTIGFLSSGASTPNELRLMYDGTNFAIGRTVGGTDVTFGTCTAADYGFIKDKLARIDIVVQAVCKKVTASGLQAHTSAEAQNGLLRILVYIDRQLVVFHAKGNAQISDTSVPGHAFRLDHGETYIQRLNLSVSDARYGKGFVVHASGGAVFVSQILPTLVLGSGQAQVSGASPYYANTWTDRSGGSSKPSVITIADGGGIAATRGIEVSAQKSFALKLPYQSRQHFSYALRLNGTTGNAVGFWLRASDAAAAPSSFYYIGIDSGKVVFGKNVSTSGQWQASASVPSLQANQWLLLDMVVHDVSQTTQIEVYLNRQKVLFAISGSAEGLTTQNGTVVDTSPVQSGDYMGFSVNRSSLTARLSAFIGSGHEQEILLKDAYASLFPIGMTVQTGNTTRYDNVGLTRHFNSLTAEYQMKWSQMQQKEGTFNWTQSNTLINYAKQNDMKVRGHALVWYKSIPSWIFKDIPEEPSSASKQKLLDRISDHVETVVEHFDDTVYVWDVVNEAITNLPNAQEVTSGEFYRTNRPGNADGIDGVTGWDWYKYCGTDYIYEAFRAADRARTKAGLTDLKLYYNDYNLMFQNKRNAVVKMVEDMQAAGVPIDGIGMQSHFKYDTFSAVELEKSIKAFTDLGLDVQLTEVDISLFKGSESTKTDLTDAEFAERSAIQAQAFRDIFRIARKYAVPQSAGGGRVTGVTFWGVADDASWLSSEFAGGDRKDHGLFFDRQFSKKSAYDAVVRF